MKDKLYKHHKRSGLFSFKRGITTFALSFVFVGGLSLPFSFALKNVIEQEEQAPQLSQNNNQVNVDLV